MFALIDSSFPINSNSLGCHDNQPLSFYNHHGLLCVKVSSVLKRRQPDDIPVMLGTYVAKCIHGSKYVNS